MVDAVALALIQFFWQGCLVAAVVGTAMVVLRSSRPEVRYTAACLGLLLMALLPLATFALQTPRAANPQSDKAGETSNSPLPAIRRALLPLNLDSTNPWRTPAAEDLLRPAGRVWLRVTFVAWVAGVSLLCIRCFFSGVCIRRLRWSGRSVAAEVRQATSRMLARLAVSTPVAVLESSLVSVPAVIGWFRPVILVPAGVFIGLSASQLDAIIAHEVAHIRRRDNLVNLFQIVVETLLFYHPAVWFVSNRIRTEREHCCDDLAIAACGDRFAYAKALVDLEKRRSQGLAFAMQVNGGSLTARIRRLLKSPPQNDWRDSIWIAACLVVTVAILLSRSGITKATTSPTPVPPYVASTTESATVKAPIVAPPAAAERPLPQAATPAEEKEEELTDVTVGFSMEDVPAPWGYSQSEFFSGSIRRSPAVFLVPFAIRRDDYDTRITLKYPEGPAQPAAMRLAFYSVADSLHAADRPFSIRIGGIAPVGTWSRKLSELLQSASDRSEFRGYLFVESPIAGTTLDVQIIRPDGDESRTPVVALPTPRPPQFEVVSIKENRSGAVPSAMGVGPVGPATGPMGCHGTDRGPEAIPLGRCIFKNVTAGFLISIISVLDEKEYRLGDLPRWVTSTGYDIEAKAESPVPQRQLGAMLRSVLTERFQASFHRETKEVAGLALTVARDHPNLRKAGSQDPMLKNEENTSIDLLDDTTGRRFSSSALPQDRLVLLTTSKTSMGFLATFISRMSPVPVVDRTGLDGFYTFQLRWQPVAISSTNVSERTGPSLYTALEEQLGLKLQSGKVPVTFLILDHIEKPTLN
jgi:uncharacterized protein (TIGR03435 family)